MHLPIFLLCLFGIVHEMGSLVVLNSCVGHMQTANMDGWPPGLYRLFPPILAISLVSFFHNLRICHGRPSHIYPVLVSAFYILLFHVNSSHANHINLFHCFGTKHFPFLYPPFSCGREAGIGHAIHFHVCHEKGKYA